MTKPTVERLPMTVENFRMFAVKLSTLISKCDIGKINYLLQNIEFRDNAPYQIFE